MSNRAISLIVVLVVAGFAVVAITNHIALSDLRQEVKRLNGTEAASSEAISESVQGVESSTKSLGDKVDSSTQTLGDKIDTLVTLAEEAATPHDWCGEVRVELEYASDQFNKRLDNNIYKQQLFQARIDALMGLAASWNCPLQSFYGFTGN
ncbi:MAG: hypothetical protein OXG27_00255 [Chloroflexi bacterium]|nr:hypothetical protein [Chloroflexota bacterium]